DDRVLLGVEPAAELVALAGGHLQFLAQAPDFETVPEPARGAVVSRRQKALVLDQDGPDPAPQARGTPRDELHDIHEVLVPAGAGDALPGLALCLGHHSAFAVSATGGTGYRVQGTGCGNIL